MGRSREANGLLSPSLLRPMPKRLASSRNSSGCIDVTRRSSSPVLSPATLSLDSGASPAHYCGQLGVSRFLQRRNLASSTHNVGGGWRIAVRHTYRLSGDLGSCCDGRLNVRIHRTPDIVSKKRGYVAAISQLIDRPWPVPRTRGTVSTYRAQGRPTRRVSPCRICPRPSLCHRVGQRCVPSPRSGAERHLPLGSLLAGVAQAHCWPKGKPAALLAARLPSSVAGRPLKPNLSEREADLIRVLLTPTSNSVPKERRVQSDHQLQRRG
jgi:hypothetical protein